MKFLFTAEVNVPIKKTFELYLNKEDLKEWQKELVSFEHISGTPGEVGSVTKLTYKSVTILETITYRNMPYEIRGEYEHKRGSGTVMVHRASARFSSVEENKTLYELEMEYVKFVGFLPKLMSKLMGGMFKKYYQNQVNQFKVFAESKM